MIGLDTSLAWHLVQTLPSGLPGLFNPWKDRCVHDTDSNGPEQRLDRLAAHLDCDARVILIGEAPGYQGCRYSGVAFSSERLILEGAIPRVPALCDRMSERKLPFSEPSATLVWKNLYALGLERTTICWNALQLHPFRSTDGVWTNRTPTNAELAHGVESLVRLKTAFPDAMMVAVGKKAEQTMDVAGINAQACVRHPAYGGGPEFGAGLKALVDGCG